VGLLQKAKIFRSWFFKAKRFCLARFSPGEGAPTGHWKQGGAPGNGNGNWKWVNLATCSIANSLGFAGAPGARQGRSRRQEQEQGPLLAHCTRRDVKGAIYRTGTCAFLSCPFHLR
jgi:hypothetical protein